MDLTACKLVIEWDARTIMKIYMVTL